MLINLSEFGVVDNTYDLLPKDLTFGNLSVHIEGTKVIMSNGVEASLNTEDYTFRISFDFAKHYVDKLSYKG